MTLTHVITAYLNLNLLVVAAFAGLALYPMLAGAAKRSISAGALLKLHYTTLSIVFLLLLLYPFLPEKSVSGPTVQIWSSHSVETHPGNRLPPDEGGYLELRGIVTPEPLHTGSARFAVFGFVIILFMSGVSRLSRDLYRLYVIRKRSHLIRRYGSVSICSNDTLKVPFSYWLPGNAIIIIPTDLIGRWQDYKIAILHELQHHRHGDTKWVYLMWLLRSMCILNPCAYFWCRLTSELQEFACDDVLVKHKRIDSKDYARCLYETARSASGKRYEPLCATGVMLIQRRFLKRRIEKMLGKRAKQIKWHFNMAAAVLIVGVMVSISFASKGVVKDRRITEHEAITMAEGAGKDTDFPVVANDLVLKELNAYLGTPEGREFIKGSLARMKEYRGGIEEKIEEYGVPTEFLAIPLVESGYRNLEQRERWGAGLWMFIQSTARAFGLTVNDEVDERLDIDILTDAAMRYLLANKLRFNDWQLAVLAYNVGESNVQKAIERTGYRDVWDLSKEFYKNGNNYYAQFMAALIILKNPDMVDHKLAL